MKTESRRFYRALASLVIPITIQNFITNAVNSADVFMLGYVGQTELSAVSLANQFQFLLFLPGKNLYLRQSLAGITDYYRIGAAVSTFCPII